MARTLEEAITRNEAALGAMLSGDCSGYVSLLSERDDVSWGNPFGPFAVGRKDVEAALTAAAARMQGGTASAPDTIATYQTSDLAVVVQVERGEGPNGPIALRVTSAYRLEGAEWTLVHRHADPINAPR
jgi:ketosteroid isomerase-like protein